MSRETFLARIRDAAQKGCAYRVHVEPLPENVSYIGAEGNLCDVLADEVQEVGGIAHVVENKQAARSQLAELLQQYNVKSGLCWQHDVLEKIGLGELLQTTGATRHDYDSLVSLDDQQRRATIIAADIGISSVDFAIAETGTLMVCSRPGQERVASLLPPVHVAVVEQAQIVPDLIDAIGKLTATDFEALPSNVALITGPSKTGDIELQLTTGVHGPGKWHVIVVRSG